MKKENNPLVSVVVPCYNVEKKIIPLLESLTRQTYTNQELIFINDGSTDDTEKVILSYKEKFCSMGMKFLLKTQENRGPGGAINTGLKYVSGNYLIWPDSDDWLSDDSIEKKCQYLMKHPQYGVVTSNAKIYLANKSDKSIGKIVNVADKNVYKTNHFENLIHLKSVFCPGCHMIRVDMMKKINPYMDIYECRGGQNIQLLLPMYYFYKRAFIDENLYNYIIYENSMSRKYNTFERKIHEEDIICENFNETLDRIQMREDERDGYKKMVKLDSLHRRLGISLQFGKSNSSIKYLQDIKREKGKFIQGKLLLLMKQVSIMDPISDKLINKWLF